MAFENSEEIEQELEVLESIYPDELTKLSDKELEISLSLEDPTDTDRHHPLLLRITYTPLYPNEPPDLSISQPEDEHQTGEPFLQDEDIEELTDTLRQMANDSLGMAMVFTLSSAIPDAVITLQNKRRAAKDAAARKKAAEAEEAERAKTRGTPVTAESFNAWKLKFDVEMARFRKKEEEEKLKALPPKEREDMRKWINKLTGRQLFESNKDLESSDTALANADDKEVDISQYEREALSDEEEERIHLSDSD